MHHFVLLNVLENATNLHRNREEPANSTHKSCKTDIRPLSLGQFGRACQRSDCGCFQFGRVSNSYDTTCMTRTNDQTEEGTGPSHCSGVDVVDVLHGAFMNAPNIPLS